MGAWAGGAAQLKLGKQALKDQRSANRDLTRRMEGAQGEYSARRPANSLARQYALQNLMALYGPANSMMGEMTGGRYSMDLEQPTDRWPDMAAAQQQTIPQGPSGPLVRPPQGFAAPGWSNVAGAAQPLSRTEAQTRGAQPTTPVQPVPPGSRRGY